MAKRWLERVTLRNLQEDVHGEGDLDSTDSDDHGVEAHYEHMDGHKRPRSLLDSACMHAGLLDETGEGSGAASPGA